MQKSEVKDLTVGSPMKLILSFAVPMLLGFLFQQFYNMVDTIIVGKCLGVSSLAAVGSTGSINFMIIGFCTGACSGFAIPVAQKFGAGDYKGMRKFVANAGWLSAVFAVVMTTVVGALCMNILQWMNTPEDIIQGAYDYIFVIFLGIPVLLFVFKEPLGNLVEKRHKKMEGGKVMFFVQAFFELFETMLSYFSNTISYVRIGAFAVSHAAMMEVVLMLSGASAGSTNWIIFVIGNIIVCGLEGLVVGIQVLRLEYYEMFSRFYKGTGREFKPFHKQSE